MSTDTTGTSTKLDDETAAVAARVRAGERFEPGQDLPEVYVREAARMMEFHMSSELVGPVQEYQWVPRAPSLEGKLVLAAKTQDEVGHALALIRVCEDLTGKSRREYMEEILEGPPRFMNIFHYPWDDWADPVVAAWLADGAEIKRQKTLLRSSYGPYARAMKKIVKEEGFHHQAGRYLMQKMVDAGATPRRHAQEAVNRWWPRILAMFGPRGKASSHGEVMLAFQLKLSDNEELRQSYLTTFIPKIRQMGLEVPDDNLGFDEETGEWSYTEPDWVEFRSLLRGGSPYGEELQRSLRNGRKSSSWFLDDTWGS